MIRFPIIGSYGWNNNIQEQILMGIRYSNENQVLREKIIKISKSGNNQKDYLWYWKLVSLRTQRFMKQAQGIFLLHAQTQKTVLYLESRDSPELVYESY